jgi:sorting nexin-9/18/33
MQAYVPPIQHQSSLQSAQDLYGDTVSMHTIHSVIPDRSIPSVPKKNNKFSTLVKSGEEGFLLCSKKVMVPESEKMFIEEVEDGRFAWVPTGENYNCVVTSPKKESKLKGLKSFIVYQLTPTVIILYVLEI